MKINLGLLDGRVCVLVRSVFLALSWGTRTREHENECMTKRREKELAKTFDTNFVLICGATAWDAVQIMSSLSSLLTLE